MNARPAPAVVAFTQPLEAGDRPDVVCAWCPTNGRPAAIILKGNNPALPKSHGMCLACVKDETTKGGW